MSKSKLSFGKAVPTPHNFLPTRESNKSIAIQLGKVLGSEVLGINCRMFSRFRPLLVTRF